MPGTLPASGGPIDVLLHLHGHPAGGPGGYLGGAKDTDVTDPGAQTSSPTSPQADDIDEYRIGAQLAAAGRPMVAILPQGFDKSDFGAGRARAFDADSYIASTFGRLTTIGVWSAAHAPTPGPVVLSGHSGADNPISTMLSSTLAPDKLTGLSCSTPGTRKPATPRRSGPTFGGDWTANCRIWRPSPRARPRRTRREPIRVRGPPLPRRSRTANWST